MTPTNSKKEQTFRILVADDDSCTRALLRHQLKSAGHNVVEAEDGAEALYMLRDDPSIRLTMLDWHMPGGPDEHDLCEKVRYIGHATYIIIVTGDGDLNTAASALNTGANDYILKPWNKEILLARVGVGCRLIAMQDQLTLQATALKFVANAIMITDHEGAIEWINPAFTKLTGYTIDEIKGQPSRTIQCGKSDTSTCDVLWKTISSGQTWRGELPNQRKNGVQYTEETTITPVVRDGAITHFIAIKQDITERKILEGQLVHAQKMESIGQLAAGIAHEINTPIQYVGDNTRFVRDSVVDLLALIAQQSDLIDESETGAVDADHRQAVRDKADELDLDFVREEIPKAIEQTLEGVDRVTEIVRAMKDFSHPGATERALTDLNKAIASTITVCRNRWKYVADLETDFADDLPPVPCLMGEFNQVILNLVVNAADAISDVVGENAEKKGLIKVSTRLDGRWIEVRVQDTGGGIPDNIGNRIFDPFFTTKEVGKGTGQGLAISHDVIVNKHNGTIEHHSEQGVGTTFIIRMPLDEPAEAQRKEAA